MAERLLPEGSPYLERSRHGATIGARDPITGAFIGPQKKHAAAKPETPEQLQAEQERDAQMWAMTGTRSVREELERRMAARERQMAGEPPEDDTGQHYQRRKFYRGRTHIGGGRGPGQFATRPVFGNIPIDKLDEQMGFALPRGPNPVKQPIGPLSKYSEKASIVNNLQLNEALRNVNETLSLMHSTVMNQDNLKRQLIEQRRRLNEIRTRIHQNTTTAQNNDGP